MNYWEFSFFLFTAVSGGACFSTASHYNLSNRKWANHPKDYPSAKIQNFLAVCKFFSKKVRVFLCFFLRQEDAWEDDGRMKRFILLRLGPLCIVVSANHGTMGG